MNAFRFILRSLLFYWRPNLAVAVGVAAATAVLTGALVVGDSVRGTLRQLTLDRLGRIDQALVADRFFRAELSRELAASEGFADHFSAAATAILFEQGSLEWDRADGRVKRASGVTVVGAGAEFWELGEADNRPARQPGKDEIILSEPLARDLGIEASQPITAELTLRLPTADQVPADSPLGKKKDLQQKWAQLRVIEIMPARGLGRFGLRPSQETPRCAFVSREMLQTGLKLEGDRVNAIFLAGRDLRGGTPAGDRWLAEHFRPAVGDYGVRVSQTKATFQPAPDQTETAFSYWSVSSDRMLFDDRLATAIESALATEHAQPSLSYLANDISLVGDAVRMASDAPRTGGIPYSIVSAIDSIAGLGPVLDEKGEPIGPLGEDEIVLTSWAADDLKAEVGSRVSLTYFEPESTHGQNVEQSAIFRVRGIAPLVKPARPSRGAKPVLYTVRQRPTNDPNLVPNVPGITDADSVRDWSNTFPFIVGSRFRPQDHDFWYAHRTTPKAYISLSAGRGLWKSRFGETTLYRFPLRETVTAAGLEEKLRGQIARDRVPLGSGFMPVKRQGLAASAGATPFDVLFLGLSLFILAAALLLVSLLFRLGFATRATTTGVLLAMGVRRRSVGWMLLVEGLFVAAVGGAMGVPLGLAYAAAMIGGLNSYWSGAVAESPLSLFANGRSLGIGFAGGLVMAGLTIAWSVRGLRGISERRLLSGNLQESSPAGEGKRQSRWPVVSAAALAVLAVGLVIAALPWGGDAQAGAFVGGGMLLLLSALLVTWFFLGGAPAAGASGFRQGKFALLGLAWRNAGRNRLRSTLTIGLVAAAAFLIAAMSAFRQDPTEAGCGGFSLLATSDRPVFIDWNDPKARDGLLAGDAADLSKVRVVPLRLKRGDDASCRNLYQAGRPQFLGVTDALADFYEHSRGTPFVFAVAAAQSNAAGNNPWRLLTESTAGSDEPIPVILDQATAMYGLHLYGGVGEVFRVPGEGDGEISLRVVGLLSNSVLQGNLLVGERDFVRLFPETAGYRMFLIQPPAGSDARHVGETLETALASEGLSARPTKDRLAELLAVQNTYLSTFQSLGGLGLLLGTLGLAAVQMRNVQERRGELALLTAVGLRPTVLGGLVLAEHAVLLVMGLAAGCLAASLAIAPQIILGAAHARPAAQLGQLALVLVVGLLAGALAVRSALRSPVVSALRGG